METLNALSPKAHERSDSPPRTAPRDDDEPPVKRKRVTFEAIKQLARQVESATDCAAPDRTCGRNLPFYQTHVMDKQDAAPPMNAEQKAEADFFFNQPKWYEGLPDEDQHGTIDGVNLHGESWRAAMYYRELYQKRGRIVKTAGISFQEHTQEQWDRVTRYNRIETAVKIVDDPNNEHDEHAKKVVVNDVVVGHLPRGTPHSSAARVVHWGEFDTNTGKCRYLWLFLAL